MGYIKAHYSCDFCGIEGEERKDGYDRKKPPLNWVKYASSSKYACDSEFCQHRASHLENKTEEWKRTKEAAFQKISKEAKEWKSIREADWLSVNPKPSEYDEQIRTS